MRQSIRKICIVCPIGCQLEIIPGEELVVQGNQCPRGVQYAREEMTNPRRILTTTVAVRGTRARLPVKTQGTIPKGMLLTAMEYLRDLKVEPPLAIGDVVVPDLLGLGVSVVACKDLPGNGAEGA